MMKQLNLRVTLQKPGEQFMIEHNLQSNYAGSLASKEYLILLVFLMFAIALTILIVGASYFLAKQNPEAEKLSAYECGFEPYEDARHTFDIKFCVIAILFIIFDIELMFLIPWCISISKLDLLGFWSMVEFLAELGFGFFYAWYVNALHW
jgi:NADH-quinone oxidoreductase subunit A